MKKRSSTPVDVLNALVWPITSVVTPGAFGSASDERRERIDRAAASAATRAACRSSFHAKLLAEVAHLAGVVEEHDAHLAGDRDQVLGVEQQALVAAEHDERARHRRPDRADVEAAHAVLAAEEQPLEDRQRSSVLSAGTARAMYSAWRAEPERRPRQVPAGTRCLRGAA